MTHPPWPHRVLPLPRYYRVAATNLVHKIVTDFGRNPIGWLTPGRFEIKIDDLYAPKGGSQALCLPMREDRFRFVIDRSFDQPCRDFLLCHEIAHTFFYHRTPDKCPWRAYLHPKGSEAHDREEKFCDAFAVAALGLRRVPEELELPARKPAITTQTFVRIRDVLVEDRPRPLWRNNWPFDTP